MANKALCAPVALVVLCGCTMEQAAPIQCAIGVATQTSPAADPADYQVDTSLDYTLNVSNPVWMVPSAALPTGLDLLASNNNVDIVFHDGRLFMAFRTAPNHFASELVRMIVLSSEDGADRWVRETQIDFEADVREPRLLSYQGELQLIFFEAGTNSLSFEPKTMWRTFRCSTGQWRKPEVLVDAPEVPWDVKVRGDVAYMTSYRGDHYNSLSGDGIDVYFKQSTDGRSWQLVDGEPIVYHGGVSEVAFELDLDGSLWAVTRNEDGDDSGYGSHVCTAKPGALGKWSCPNVSHPERYDSPEMFRHGSDVYLAARRDIGGPFGPDGSLIDYSLRPKTTAIYRIDKDKREVVHLLDIPGAGDTAFPSVRRTGEHTFLLANYTSPLDDPDISWLDGQVSKKGAQIYFVTLTFSPSP